MVPVSIRCPQGTGLPTLPLRVPQGAAVSGKHISQGPPGNNVAFGMPAPSEEGFRAVSSDASCRFAVSGRRSDCTTRRLFPFSHNQGHAAMVTCLDNVEETLVPVPGSHVGSFMSSQDANDRCFSHGLGSNLRGTLKSGSVEGPSSLMVHQPSGDVGCISSLRIS